MSAERALVVRLTPSQRMALLDIIMATMHGPLALEVYVDVVRRVDVRPEELLNLVLQAPEE